MRAIALDYSHRSVVEIAVAPPQRERSDQVVIAIKEVGVCGTDRELSAFRLGYPPEGDTFLIPGHEALGQVVDAGSDAAFERGDWVVPMVRRPCVPACPSCARGRRDLCVSGNYRERGIFGMHGYFAEYAVDSATDVVRVPESLLDYAVLIEPLSVVEKAIENAIRFHEPGAKTALVLGAGPIGLLAGLAFQVRGFDASIYSLEPPGGPRAQLVRDAGMCYLDSLAGVKADIVLEATGSPEAALQGMRALAPVGVYAVLGGSNPRGEIPFIDMLVNNQVIFGSVNASPEAFRQALEDLARFDPRVLKRMIHRVRFGDFARTATEAGQGAPKTVHVIRD